VTCVSYGTSDHTDHNRADEITAATTEISRAAPGLPQVALVAWHVQLLALTQRHPTNSALRDSVLALALPPRTAQTSTRPAPARGTAQTDLPQAAPLEQAQPRLNSSQRRCQTIPRASLMSAGFRAFVKPLVGRSNGQRMCWR
jgi:hypothetical protein